MDEILHESEPTDSVKSVTLAELRAERSSAFGRIVGFGKALLMLWGALSLGAAAGTAAFYLEGSKLPVLVSETEPAREEPKPLRIAVLTDIASPGGEGAPPAGSEVAPLEIPEPIIEEARLPRPRPDEPVYTGSVGAPAYDPYAVPPQERRHLLDPCAALNDLGAPFPFRLRCSYQTRAYAPPPPRPYYAPYVIR